jgi:gliding motility-associated-like protein
MNLERNKLEWVFYDATLLGHPTITGIDTHELGQVKIQRAGTSLIDKNIGATDPEAAFNIKGHRYTMEFLGMSADAYTTGEDPFEHYSNFFLGSDPKKWASRVKSYTKIYIHNLYKNIDLELYSTENKYIKYNFILHPGALITDIRIKYDGMSSTYLSKGKLVLKTSVSESVDEPPLAWYGDGKAELVSCKYKLDNNILTYQANNYNNKRKFIIDPKLVFSSYSASTADNWGFTATYDPEGNGYSGGIVLHFSSPSTGQFPATTGAFQTVFQGGDLGQDEIGGGARDIGILKYKPDGKSLVYATYVGGSANEHPHSMVVNNAGELCVMGSTFSSDFPMFGSSFQSKIGGRSDIVVFKLSADGTQMTASTFLGGSGRDGLNGALASSYKNSSAIAYNYGDIFRGEIVNDVNDNLYIASCTESSQDDGFPAKGGLFKSFSGGVLDGCIFKLSKNLNAVLWGSYLGGGGYDAAYGVHIALDGNIYVCGGTESGGLLMVAGKGYQTAFNGGDADGFLYHLNGQTGGLLAATYLGTNKYDQAYLVQVDKHGEPYVYGQTSGAWPVSPNVYTNPGSGQYIIRLSEDLSQMQRSTVFGGSRLRPDISPSAFLVDKCDRVFVSGWGGGVNDAPRGNGGTTTYMKVSANAFQSKTDGSDFYLAAFSCNMDSLLYATFFGGLVKNSQGEPLEEHVDGGTSRFDYEGKVYQSVCGGCGGSNNFPTTPGAWSRINKSNNCNNAIFKIDFESLNYKPKLNPPALVEAYASDTITFSMSSFDVDCDDSLFIRAEGDIFTKSVSPLPVMPADSGSHAAKIVFNWFTGCQHISEDTITIFVTVRDNNSCPAPDTSKVPVRILVKPPPLIKPPNVFCVHTIDDQTVKISWNGLDDSKYFLYYLLYRRDPSGLTTTIDTIRTSNVGEYIDNNAPNNQLENYCYIMQGVNICKAYGDSSYKACSADEILKPIDSVYIYHATVVGNKFVGVRWVSSKEPDFNSYIIFRSSGRNVKPGADNKLYKTFSNVTDTFFIDSSVNVADSPYCYRIRVTDKCGHISGFSNDACTIVLRGKSEEYLHNLTWTNYTQWPQNVARYDIYRYDSLPTFNYIDRVNGTTLVYGDTTMFYDWGKYTYRITAYEKGGLQATSQSNEVTLIQSPLLWVPNAFSPNEDGLNDEWGIVPVFVKDFKLKVFNRWGELMFETENKKAQWDGSYRNERFDNNFYIWQVYYTGWDDSQHTDHGIVITLK